MWKRWGNQYRGLYEIWVLGTPLQQWFNVEQLLELLSGFFIEPPVHEQHVIQ